MDSLNQIEIQNIRHVVGCISNMCCKIDYYKTLTNDTDMTDLYNQICTQSDSLKQELSNML